MARDAVEDRAILPSVRAVVMGGALCPRIRKFDRTTAVGAVCPLFVAGTIAGGLSHPRAASVGGEAVATARPQLPGMPGLLPYCCPEAARLQGVMTDIPAAPADRLRLGDVFSKATAIYGRFVQFVVLTLIAHVPQYLVMTVASGSGAGASIMRAAASTPEITIRAGVVLAGGVVMYGVV